jgi:SAM-dependent methyltransferase
VFRGLLERGDLTPGARVLDIGGGQGLVAALLHASEQVSAGQGWPAQWRTPAPWASAYTCIELMPRDARRGAAALAGLPFAPHFINADMRQTPLPACDVVLLLDVLHYVDHAAQDALLKRVRQALAPQGRLLLRVGDSANCHGFAISQWVDRIVTGVRGHRVPPTWGRPLEDWIAALRELGFNVHAVPMSQGTPFANVLLVGNLN